MATILIIDDEPAIRGMLKLQLEKAGHAVLEAGDGQEGVLVAETMKPDLVFLDVMIPKLDGWQVCRRIKSEIKTKAIPVVMLTGCQQKIEEMRAWESGVDAYLTKPWKVDELLELTRKFLLVPKAL